MDLFKTLIWDTLIKAALKKLFLKVPLLGWGPIGFLVSHFVFKFTDMLYLEVKDFINIKMIFFKNKEAHDKYAEASKDLALILKDKGVESDDFKKAREAHKEALSNFVRFGVARGN